MDTSACIAALKSLYLMPFTDAGLQPTAGQQAQAQYQAEQQTLAVANLIKSLVFTYTSGLTTPSGGGPVTGSIVYTIS